MKSLYRNAPAAEPGERNDYNEREFNNRSNFVLNVI